MKLALRHHGLDTVAAAFVASAIVVALPAHGGVQEFGNKDEWIPAVGEFTTVDFTGFDVGTFITDQYADSGVLFTDGNDVSLSRQRRCRPNCTPDCHSIRLHPDVTALPPPCS